MDTPLEESNLAHIGSDEDKAAREAAAQFEVNWEGAGAEVGIQIWRVENVRDEFDNPVFGIHKWPEKRYGEFYDGDSYILLHTTLDEEGESKLLWDIHFWIGSESSQDEYGVAAYKANELDDFLGTAAVQYRETQDHESEDFLSLFPKGIRYLDGGIDGGFRNVGADSNDEFYANIPKRLFHCRRTGRKEPKCSQVPVGSKSLNQGDCFVLDAGKEVYTWFGEECSPFEKRKASEIAHNIVLNRYGHSQLVEDVDDEHEEFWTAMGGKGDIASASDYQEKESPEETPPKMYIVSDDVDARIQITQVMNVSKSALDSNNVNLIDVGSHVYVWIGKGASHREKSQSMVLVNTHLKNFSREQNTKVVRLLEGQESRCKGFKAVMSQ